MNRSSLEVYAYVVCVLALICGVIVLGLFSYNIVRVLAPSFTLSEWQVISVSSNEEFKKSYGKDVSLPQEEDKITQLREQKHRLLISLERQRGFQNLVFQGIILIINTVVFIIHWKIGRRKSSQNVR